jgi:Pvc16 N-terminal domain
MSNSLAIAAVTATLRNLLTTGVASDPDLNDTTVTVQPLDRARPAANNANQINIFLYQALPNAAWRNMDMPGRTLSNETAMPPLALNLYYLITAFGRDNDATQPFSHQLLGKAMSVLNDHAVLLHDEIKGALPRNDLFAQIERVRLTLQPLNVDEIFKLWSGFQTQYRLSVAYEACVVLIDSASPARAPLPVLRRGTDDTGAAVQGNLLSSFPEITAITPPRQQPAAILGDVITIAGRNLAGDIQAVFRSVRLANPIRVAAAPGATADQVQVQIDDDPAKWLAGYYTVSLEVTENKGKPDENVRSTNEVPFSIAPVITTKFPINAAAGASATVTLRVTPRVLPEQRVALLLGSQEVVAEPFAAAAAQLRFVIRPATKGSYLVRLRVDGADTQLVDRSSRTPVFKDQRLVIA